MSLLNSLIASKISIYKYIVALLSTWIWNKQFNTRVSLAASDRPVRGWVSISLRGRFPQPTPRGGFPFPLLASSPRVPDKKKTDRFPVDSSRSDPIAVAPTYRRRCRRQPTGVLRPTWDSSISSPSSRPFWAPRGRYAPIVVAPRSAPAAAVAADHWPESCEPMRLMRRSPSAPQVLPQLALDPRQQEPIVSPAAPAACDPPAGTRSPLISPSISVVLVNFCPCCWFVWDVAQIRMSIVAICSSAIPFPAHVLNLRWLKLPLLSGDRS